MWRNLWAGVIVIGLASACAGGDEAQRVSAPAATSTAVVASTEATPAAATPAPTATATPAPTATATPAATATPTPAPTSTATPATTAILTPAPTATATPAPTATATFVPTPSPGTVVGAPPAGFSSFYAKHLDAGGIAIVGSSKVPDSAFFAAQEIVNRMLAARPDIRAAMISQGAYAGIIAASEVTTDIPEHAFLKNDANTDWDARARGLGGTIWVPITTGAEENLLCYSADQYGGESIFLHEFAHGVFNLGLPFVTGGPATLVGVAQAYAGAIAAGLWANTYAATDVIEYWAEGVQSWFDANRQAVPADGVHNAVNTQDELRSYDGALAGLIEQVFGAGWSYRCP